MKNYINQKKIKINNIFYLFVFFCLVLFSTNFISIAYAEEEIPIPSEEQIVPSTEEQTTPPLESPPTVTEETIPTPEPTPDLTANVITASPDPIISPPPMLEDQSIPLPSPANPIPMLEDQSIPLPSPEPNPTPTIEPVVPFVSINGHAFDPAIAPSKVKVKILNLNGAVPIIPIFVSFVGVGGKTYGGPINNEGVIEAIMPTGRYYTDILVLDTKSGPPNNPPSFFLEANEERDFGTLILTDKSSFSDEPLEQEFKTTLEEEGQSGFAKIFSLIVKLLFAILKELRGLRADLAS